MKTTFLALFLVTTSIFAKVEVKSWQPKPVYFINDDGDIEIFIPPLETVGEGQKL